MSIKSSLSEKFLTDLFEVWTERGEDCLQKMASDDPKGFVRVAASLVPKESQLGIERGFASLLKEINERSNRRITNEPSVIDITPKVERETGEVCARSFGGDARNMAGRGSSTSGG